MARRDIAGQRRVQLVEAAIRVMAREGWQSTSISGVTKEAGVSRGLASYHFRDKSELLSAVLSRCREKFTTAVLEGSAEGTSAEQMRRIIQLALRQIREDPVVFQVFLHFTAAAPSVPELGDEIRSLWGTFRHITAEGIRAGQRDGSYRSEIDAEAAAAELLGGIVGLALQWMLDPGSFDLDQAGRGLEKHFMADLIAPTPAPGWD